jgi:myosin-1
MSDRYDAQIENDLDCDLAFLDEINTDTITAKLEERYKAEKIYTYIGPVLIAVNPYKLIQVRDMGIDIYDNKVIKEYQKKMIHEVKPHPFAVAEDAYRNMCEYGNDNCIIVTGESGAGKTETAKQMMKYISVVSSSGAAKGGNINHVSELLLSSNPVLESFGNAQTLRNNNSSRFGKYMVLQFDMVNEIKGGFITNYLLEKSRVTGRNEGERCFHAFYQLIHGSSAEDKKAWQIDCSPDDFVYMEKSAAAAKDNNMCGEAEWTEVRKSMTTLGMPETDQSALYRALAVVLWLGNLEFTQNDKDESSVASGSAAIEKLATLIGVSKDQIENAVCKRTVSAGAGSRASVHSSPLSKDQAKVTTDTLSRALYSKCFDWLVRSVNKAIHIDSGTTKHRDIGILDIYGFEIFELNSFEQLCINYVNEKLQQIFIELTLKAEQEEYASEGIEWTPVDYFDNKVVCDLIEKKPEGLFNLMNEACTKVESTDEELVQKYHSTFDKHAHYAKPKFSGVGTTKFGVIHYAGEVEYDVTGFIIKNRDTLFNDVSEMMCKSTQPFFQELFEDKRPEADRKKRPPTASTQFKTSVAALITDLMKCVPHYIRTLKPNEVKKPGVFDVPRCTHQVTYLGLVENVRIRRAGFCYRVDAGRFMRRFRCLSAKTWPKAAGKTLPQEAEVLLTDKEAVWIEDAAGLKDYFLRGKEGQGAFQVGTSKVFIRQPKGLFALEILRQKKLPWVAKIMQNSVRRFLFRSKMTRYKMLHADIMKAFNDYSQNCTDRTARKGGETTALREQTVATKAQWNLKAAKIKTDHSLHKKMDGKVQDMHASFTQGHMRAIVEKKKFGRVKQASTRFQAAVKGLNHRRKMPLGQWEQCHNAMLTMRVALEKFQGEKRRRKGSFNREKLGDYGDKLKDTGNSGKFATDPNVLLAMGKATQSKVHFGADVVKVNSGKLKQWRALIITEECVFNLDGKTRKEKRCAKIDAIATVKMSNFADNFLIISFKGEQDLCVICQQKIEAVNILRTRYTALTKKTLNIAYANTFEVNQTKSMMQKPTFTVSFSEVKDQPGTTYSKNKEGVIAVAACDTSPYASKDVGLAEDVFAFVQATPK